MTEVQERLLSLVDEIISICDKKKLRYIVGCESAAYILDHKKFEDEQCYFKLMMPLGDIVTLRDYVAMNLSDTREIESWENSPRLLHFKYRYVDKTTLLYDGGSTEHHHCYGVNVQLIPVNEFEASEEARGIERYLYMLNKGTGDKVRKVIVGKLITRVTHINYFMNRALKYTKIDNANYIHKGYAAAKTSSPAELAKFVCEEKYKAKKPFMSDRFIPEEEKEKNPEKREQVFAYGDERCNVIKLPKDLFSNVKFCEFEGRSYPVYSDDELYFSQLYGKDWYARSRDPLGGTDRTTVLWDLDIPYAEYVEYVKDDEVSLDDIRDKKAELNAWLGSYYNPAVRRNEKTFNTVRRSVDRIDIWYKLQPKREELRKAYEESDLKKLKSIMKPYLDATDKYYDMKIGFYIDDELFKYAQAIWEAEGKIARVTGLGEEISYAMSVYARVPDIYKEETPEEYFKKRGTQVIW